MKSSATFLPKLQLTMKGYKLLIASKICGIILEKKTNLRVSSLDDNRCPLQNKLYNIENMRVRLRSGCMFGDSHRGTHRRLRLQKGITMGRFDYISR